MVATLHAATVHVSTLHVATVHVSALHVATVHVSTLHCLWTPDGRSSRVAVALQAVVADSKLISSAPPADASCPHWSCILFVTRKMTCLGLGALFEAAPCLQPWSAATLMGYGSNTEAVKQTTTVCLRL